MSGREFLKRSESLVGAVHDCKRLLASVRPPERQGLPPFAKRYLATAALKKLEIGSGPKPHEGWLGADKCAVSKETIYLDATKSFPFADATFDYIYNEHMIEHIAWGDGLSMLKECYRVLKPTGALRIATPDLAVVAGLLTSPDELAKRYIAFFTDSELKDVPGHKPAFVINLAFHGWGHQFLYDAETLEFTLRLAGFKSVSRHAPRQSGDSHLRGLESDRGSIEKNEVWDYGNLVLEARTSACGALSESEVGCHKQREALGAGLAGRKRGN